jgi:triosephosphate isomerase (TIM)
MRKTIIAGNWKMNKNNDEASVLAKGILERVSDVRDVEMVLCPTFTSLSAVGDVINGTNIALGAQNMHWEKKGAYTGEISANMLLTLGCEYVILCHSERRSYFYEKDDICALKVASSIESGLTPIFCVGETQDQREDGITERVIETQIRGALDTLTPEQFDGSVVAYEPVWAIGTGLTATAEQAQEVHAFIRGILSDLFGSDVAEKTRIQYGGSMKPSNAEELLAQPDIDGGLIGGAALDAESFEGIIRASQV